MKNSAQSHWDLVKKTVNKEGKQRHLFIQDTLTIVEFWTFDHELLIKVRVI